MVYSESLALNNKWQFWIDRGGTFTDIVAKTPQNKLLTRKLLSENPEAYADAALHGMRGFLGLNENDPIMPDLVSAIKMGTTVATNALLEKKGDDTVLAITQGFKDIIEIGYQARPKTFELDIQKPDLLYSEVFEVEERLSEDGKTEQPLNLDKTRQSLEAAYAQGYRSIAIVLMHAFKFPVHEIEIIKLAREIGFTQISASHEVSPLTKIVSRGQTTIVDAYLTPILRRYVDRISAAMGNSKKPGQLLFMQSSGGLVDAQKFRGRDAILSGPAGGIVGAVHTAKLAGFEKIIGFDMGGTSTDVSHYAGEFEKVYETEVAGVQMRVPMMYIHTVAAGGGSLLKYEDKRFQVGPESAGANPGPVSYRRGGSLAVTDINVALGKIQPDFFPNIFGPDQDKALDRDAALEAFQLIADEVGDGRSAADVAEGFLDIAVEHMAQAIKKISVARGYDLETYAMNCFGGAGGQHACLVAEKLGMNTIFLHPLSGVLSAYGMGLADISTERQRVIELDIKSPELSILSTKISELKALNQNDLLEQGLTSEQVSHKASALVRYKGTDTTIKVSINEPLKMRAEFEDNHYRQFGFTAPEKNIILETITVESFGGRDEHIEDSSDAITSEAPQIGAMRKLYSDGSWLDAPVFSIDKLVHGHTVFGPAIITEPTGTVIVEKNWTARLNKYRHLILERKPAEDTNIENLTKYDPVRLEIFNNLFMSIAEQMGLVLQNTSQSVNVKERLDFSCAVFDPQGNLIANAPHVPVHLGSMDATVKVIIDGGLSINPGDVFVQNNPYNGGSHLPDITVISPVFDQTEQNVLFYVASRAHHEDVGGIAPGSMSPLGRTIYEEGVVLDGLKLVDRGIFQTQAIHDAFSSGQYPARNIDQNIADLMAQTAANSAGAAELHKLVKQYGLETVHAYMGYIQDSAEEAVRSVIATLDDTSFEYEIDSGAVIKLNITVDKKARTAVLNFIGTSKQQPTNFNAPGAITRAAVLYVFRCLVDKDIPLNAGCMKPLEIIVPKGSMLNPEFPAAVVAGNVETSQAVTNTLFAALGALGTSQGTMNNLTFGNEKYQYYETICSGSPAGNGFNGVAAVHTHMTNTRLTDPEIMEQRYPIMLEEFVIDRNSGGKGQWNAGDGITRRIRFLEEMECSILSDHRKVAPMGVKGGHEGRLGRNWITRKSGSVEDLGGCGQTHVYPGDSVTVQSPTGGGYGKPQG